MTPTLAITSLPCAFYRPTAALALASVVCCAVLAARIGFTGRGRHLFLVWNLFLAWLPLLFALMAWSASRRLKERRGLFAGAAGAWLLFFPNAPYLVTDLVHAGSHLGQRYWPDLVMILLFAMTGMVLGFLSLFLMQGLVARRFGWPAGWVFVAGVTALGGWGVYIGRFLRWNSWDALLNPTGVIGDALGCVLAAPQDPRQILIPAMFGTLLFVAYLMLYALTRLPHSGSIPSIDAEHDCAQTPATA